MVFLSLALLTTFVGLATSQSLIFIGGNLGDANAPIWDKVVELAVSQCDSLMKKSNPIF